ncbi:putative membrane protein YhhN [Micromonospora sp. M71_S20]|uniref:lysoplasmalogenase n=1 Tax=Micromonospora sp. M71_S20 TaxID=592872 RepID=UPI000EB130D0|nr:lysoplasmalogenase [Micromonospora sp. M71_S20]RLK10013.1 putative membrane protein YhhN [Micromonospora sp. M71_S20]
MRRLWPFGVVAAVELIGVAADSALLQWLAKPLLAPVLLVHLLRVRRRVDPVAVGLVFATGGDIALLVSGDTAFLVGMGCFLGTQVAFLTAFLRHRRPPVVAVAAYLACWVAANLVLWNSLGPLRLPVLGYSLALSLMAAAAAGVSRRVALGGGLFLISDLLIGMEAAGSRVPGHGLAVMTTYIAALLLITTGWVAATAGRARPAAGDDSPAPAPGPVPGTAR